MNTVFEITTVPAIKQDQMIESEVNEGLLLIAETFITKTDMLVQKMKGFQKKFGK